MLQRPRLGLISRHHELIKRRPAHDTKDSSLPTGDALHLGPSQIGGGNGLFVDQAFAAHDCVFVDPALLSLAYGEDLPELYDKYLVLPATDRQTYDDLSQRDPDKVRDGTLASKLATRGIDVSSIDEMIRVHRLFHGNAFKFSDDEITGSSYVGDNLKFRSAVFPRVARINHSCVPNAHAHYRRELGAMVVYALRDLAIGDELSIAYFDVTLSYADRQARAANWNFACQCEACAVPPLQRKKRERLLEELRSISRDNQRLMPSVGYLATTPPPPGHLGLRIKSTERLVAELEPWASLHSQLPTLYEQLALMHMWEKQHDATLDALKHALTSSVHITGADSPPSRRIRPMLTLQSATTGKERDLDNRP